MEYHTFPWLHMEVPEAQLVSSWGCSDRLLKQMIALASCTAIQPSLPVVYINTDMVQILRFEWLLACLGVIMYFALSCAESLLPLCLCLILLYQYSTPRAPREWVPVAERRLVQWKHLHAQQPLIVWQDRLITMSATHAPASAQVLGHCSILRSTQGKLDLGHV